MYLFAVKDMNCYVTLSTVIFSHVTISCFSANPQWVFCWCSCDKASKAERNFREIEIERGKEVAEGRINLIV